MKKIYVYNWLSKFKNDIIVINNKNEYIYLYNYKEKYIISSHFLTLNDPKELDPIFLNFSAIFSFYYYAYTT